MVIENNPGFPLDLNWVNSGCNLNYQAIKRRAELLKDIRPIVNENRAAWLLKAITLIDLTTLSGDDTESNVTRLCQKAARPISEKLISYYGFETSIKSCPIKTAAVCVYPSKVQCAAKIISKLHLSDKIQVASVATGFPTGQYGLNTRLSEIEYAIDQGATEIDIVIDRSLVICGKWEELYEEIKKMKEVCGSKAHLKTILAVGELINVSNIYKAACIAMLAGSDFIKTSTGKESINATLPVGIVMCRAINDFYKRFGYKIGLKPAGGIRTAKDALNWLTLICEELDKSWITPELFRFGASGLLSDIEKELYKYATCREPASYQFVL